jgi:hypothetical protein
MLNPIPTIANAVTVIQDPGSTSTGLWSLFLSVAILLAVGLIMRRQPGQKERGLGVWRHLVHTGIFTSLAVALLAGYPEMEAAIQAVVGRTFLTELAQVYGGAGLIHLPTLFLAATMFLAYSITPLIAAAPIALADLIVERVLSWRHGLQMEPVEVAEVEE